MEIKKYNIEDAHDINCQYRGDGDWSCSDSHRTRETMYRLNQRILKLETALKERSECCESAVCRALARAALEK